jgi:DNA-binding XRE family transcriptional regulator
MTMTFADELKRWRKRMDYTQAEAAQKLGANQRTYEAWESGRHEPVALLQWLVRSTIKSKEKSHGK